MKVNLGVEEIKKILPHRDPFLLIDEVTDIVENKSARAIKNVSIDEEYFKGHFPKEPVMPGVLIVEALAQTGAVALLSSKDNNGKIAYFAGIKNCKFKRKVVPGDVLVLEVIITKLRSTFGVGEAIAKVGDEIACTATLQFAF